ncbi:MAG: hypothetical protein HND51_14890 [Chloroflexi bacterium]|nr:hypothetical protein [Chloroflexota bacterium]
MRPLIFLVMLLFACRTSSPTVPPSPIAPTTEAPLTAFVPTDEPDLVTNSGSLNPKLVVQVANDDGSPRPVLRNPQWAEDDTAIIYTLSTLNGERRFAYEMDSGETLSLSATLPPEDNSGLISPSGRYQIVVDTSNFPSPESGNTLPPFELWMVDNSSGERTLLLAEAQGEPIVEWHADERLFVLGLGAFGEATLYIGSTEIVQVVPLEDFADHAGWTYYGWSVSPNSNKLALASSDFSQLQIISLEDGSSQYAEGGNAAFFYWTPDSQRVYYKALSLKSGMEFDGYYVYDTAAQSSELLLTQDILTAEGLCLQSCYFVPSPDGSRALVGWGDYTHDYLWLIDFP